MTPDEFIERAIEHGARCGLNATSGLERTVFLISQAETLCDMEGICWFVDYLEPDVVSEMSNAFDAVGASEIAKGLSRIAMEGEAVSEEILRSTGRLITDRAGYSYESIREFVQRELK